MATSKLLDPQQRERAKKKKAAKIEENMFGKDIDEFLEDSEWDIDVKIDIIGQRTKLIKAAYF